MRGVHPAAVDWPRMRRIMIMGPSGSGKSTLADRLGVLLGIEAVHLDALFWMPGWTERPEDDFQTLVRKAAERECWVIDGNYRRTIEPRLAVADLLIFLDLPRRVYVSSVVRRQIRTYGRTRPDLGSDCPERFDLSFLRWVWDHHTKRRAEMVAQMEDYQRQLPVVWLERRAEVNGLLRIVQTRMQAQQGVSAA